MLIPRVNPMKKILLGILVATALAAFTTSAHAQAYTWTGAGGTNDTWSTATNWNTPPVGTGSSTTSLNFTFSGSGTNLVSNNDLGNFTLNQLTYSGAGNQTILGNTLLFVNNGGTGPSIVQNGGGNSALNNSIDISGGANLTLSATQPGAFTLRSTISGNGSVTLSSGLYVLRDAGASSTFSGGLTLNGSASNTSLILLAGSAGAVGAVTAGPVGTGKLTLQQGSLRSTYGSSTTVINNDVDFSGNLTFGDGGTPDTSKLTLGGNTTLTGNTTRGITLGAATTNGRPVVLAGAIAGSGTNSGLTIDGRGVQELSGTAANTYAGLTTVNSTNATLLLNKTAGVNAIAGNLTISAGTVRLGQSNQIADTSSLTLTSGTFDLNRNSETINTLLGGAGATGTISSSVAGNSTLTIAGTTAGDTAAVIANGSGTVSLVKNGAQSLTLRGASTYTGGTTLTGGTLSFANNALGTTGGITVNGGALQWNGSNTQDISSRLILQNSGSAAFDISGNNVTFANAIGNSTSSSVTKTGTGTLTLSGANTYTGSTTINNGTLTIGGSGSLGSGNYTGNIVNNGVLEYASSTSQTLSGNITGAGSVVRSTVGDAVVLTLSGTNNTYTGGTTLTGQGNIVLGANNALGNGTLTLTTGGAGNQRLNLNGFNQTITGLIYGNVNNLQVIQNGGTGAGTLTVNLASGTNSTTAASIIRDFGGTLALVKTGNGALDLSTIHGASGYSGGLTVNAGTLIFSNGLGIGTGNITLGGGTLALTANTSFTVPNTTTTLTAATSSTISVGSNSTATWSGNITGSGALTKAGTGTLTLSGANTYTDATTIGGGTLLVATNGSIASSSLATVNSGGLLKVNGTAGAITVNSGGSLSGSGTNGLVTLNRGSLLNPGNSPGTLTAASAIVLGGSTYNWEIKALSGTAGTTWDLLSVTGLLNMSDVTSTSKWNLVVTGDSGFAGWTDTSSYSYVFAQAASVSGFSSTAGTDVTSLFNITTSGIASKPNASFNANGDFKVVVGSANGFTTLNLMAVPEPSTGSMLGLGLAGLVVTRLLRRKGV